MTLFKRPLAWVALMTWGLATALSFGSVRAVSALDARTWPALELEPEWTGVLSEWSQRFFVIIFMAAYLIAILAGFLWGKVFEMRFGKSGFAQIALIGGVASVNSFILWGSSWALTFWLEDEGYYLARRNTFDQFFNWLPIATWVLGGLAFIVFSILAANKLGKR